MKAFLLASTAVAALYASTASAADAKNVTSGLQLKIGGFVGFTSALLVGGSDHQKRNRDYDFATNSRLQFDIKNVTDSGLEYGARIRLNDVNRRDNTKVNQTYVYLKGGFGTITLGDAGYAAADFGYVFAHDSVVSDMGLDGGFGDNIDHNFITGGGHFYSLDPTGQADLGKDTKIKYTSPSFSGFSFGVDFTPVVGGKDHAGSGGIKDLTNDDKTLYENVVSAGLNYKNDFGGTSISVSGAAIVGNGVSKGIADAAKKNHDLQAYSLGAKLGSGGITGSVNWVHYDSIHNSSKPLDTISSSLAYQFGAFEFGLSYAYTWAKKGNHLAGDEDHGDKGRSDLKSNHLAAGTVIYTLAPGLNTYAELSYETASFRVGPDYDNTTLLSGLLVKF